MSGLNSVQLCEVDAGETGEIFEGVMSVSYTHLDVYKRQMEYFGKVVENISVYDEIDLDSLQYYASLQTYYGDSAGAIDSYTVLIRKNYNAGQQYFLRGGI